MGMLDGCKSQCEIKQKIIVSKDKGGVCEHRAINVDTENVRKYKTDGEVFDSKEEKCDWLVLNDDKKSAYYIELKGSDIAKAISQVEATKSKLENELNGYTSYYRIIYKSGSHSVDNKKTIAWKEKCGRNENTKKPIAIIRNREYAENI